MSRVIPEKLVRPFPRSALGIGRASSSSAASPLPAYRLPAVSGNGTSSIPPSRPRSRHASVNAATVVRPLPFFRASTRQTRFIARVSAT